MPLVWCGLPWVTAKISRHVRESKTVLDSGFHAVDSRVQLLDSRSFSVELGFRIPIVSGILDFYGCIPDSKAQGFRIPQAKFSKIAESGFPYMGRKIHTGHMDTVPQYTDGVSCCGVLGNK